MYRFKYIIGFRFSFLNGKPLDKNIGIISKQDKFTITRAVNYIIYIYEEK